MHDTADHIGSHFYTQPPAPKMTNKYPPVVGPYSIDDHLHVVYTLNPRHLGEGGGAMGGHFANTLTITQ